MAAPTQQYPPWLTPVPSVIVDGNGVPISTSTTVLFLPLTYFGPSIPLGPDWTYGGLTSPAPTSTTSSPSTTATAIPSSSLSITTATPPPSSSSSSSSSSTSVSSSSSSISTISPSSTTIPVTSPSLSPSTISPTATPTNTAPAAAGKLTRGQLVGVIVASILGFIFLLVLFLAFYLFCKGKKRRRARTNGGRPIDDDYVAVGRVPGEGSPRQSGEEADPFLRPPGSGGGGGASGEKGGPGTYAEMGARPPVPPKGVQRIPPPPATIPSLSSNGSSSTGSGYGEPLAQPTLGIRPIREEHEQEMSGGRVLTPEEIRRLGDESVLPHDSSGSSDPEAGDRYSGAYAYADAPPNLPPPKLVAAAPRTSPDYTLPRMPFTKRPSQGSHRSSLPLDVDENATLLTARRVRVEDLGPRSSPGSSPIDESSSSKPSPSSFLGTLGAIAGKMSWRKSQSPRTSQQQPLLGPSPLSDRDIEQGRIPPPPIPRMRQTTTSSRGGLSVGTGPDGARPLSSVSGKSQNSGGTIYHDALSSIPSTPILTPLPRVITPLEVPPVPTLSSQRSTTPATQTPGAAAPLLIDDEQQHPNSPGGTSHAHTLVPDFDILDMPAPSALSLFGGVSATSLKPSMISDATVINNHVDTSMSTLRLYPLPPGLELIPTPKTWAEISPGDTPSPGSFGGDQENGVGVGIMIDVLEEEPPTAGEGWRTMAATSGSDNIESERLARRTTFGLPQYVHQPDFTSEQASLYSMRSHLSPASPPRSTGSAPASTRRDPSYGSNSSRPSAGGSSSGAISYAQSLARTGSITSDGRRRGFGPGPVSPALSAFGNHMRAAGSGSGSGCGSSSGGGDAFPSSREASSSASGSGEGGSGGVVVLQSPSTAYLAPTRNASHTSSPPPLSPLSMPWASGLDETWSPSS